MTIGDLIKNKDYDYISYRTVVPGCSGDIFTGIAQSKNGKLISLDGDYYSTDTEIVDYEEWEDRNKRGVVVHYDYRKEENNIE